MNKRRLAYAVWALVTMLLVGALFVIAVLSQPRRIGAVEGSVHLRQITLSDGQAGFVVEGDEMSVIGRVHGVSVRPEGQRILIDRYMILSLPFSRFQAFSDWPVLIDTRALRSGREYEVLYWSSKHRYVTLGRIKAPSARP